MKSFSPIKLFTPVMFFLVMCLTMISWGVESCPEGSIAACEAKYCDPTTSKEILADVNVCSNNPEETSSAGIGISKKQKTPNQCKADAIDSCSRIYCRHCPQEKDNTSECKEATTKLNESREDATSVCSALTNRTAAKKSSKKTDTVNNCSNKIEECDKAIKGASSANAENPEEQKDVFSDILSGMGGLFGDDANSTSSSTGCLEDYSTKANDEAEKEYKSDRKDLQKDLNDLEDDITKEKKELDEKITKIEKETIQFNKDHEKEMRTLDKEMRERLKANSDSLVESGKKVRELNKKQLAVQKSVKQISFEFEKSKQDTTEQKIDLKCKQAILIAKKCMIDSYQNKVALGSEDQCKNFPKVMSRGTKATAEFKAYLQNISDACYEELNTAKDRASFKNQQALENATEEMTELQSQLKDEQSVQQNAQNDLQKIAQESDREKNELAAALAKELAALSNEQIKATETANKKITDLNKRIVDMQRKLAELELKRRTGAKSATRIARNAVAKSTSAYDDAVASCGCQASTDAEAKALAKTNAVCSRLFKKNPEIIGIPTEKAGTKN